MKASKLIRGLPTPIYRALEHVRASFPAVSIVVFNSAGRWQYMSPTYDSFRFHSTVDVGILEDAQSAAESEGLPAVYEWPHWDKGGDPINAPRTGRKIA